MTGYDYTARPTDPPTTELRPTVAEHSACQLYLGELASAAADRLEKLHGGWVELAEHDLRRDVVWLLLERLVCSS